MGWGISISQDEKGHVYCNDADFETDDTDYDGFPPSSYDYICNYMDHHHHSEIDMARDEGSVHLANEACRDAFQSAKYAYEYLDEEEKMRMHEKWLEQTKEDIKNCVVDKLAKKKIKVEIEEYKKGNSDKITKLEEKIKTLEESLELLKSPLQILVDKLYIIQQPAETKHQLESLLMKENELFEDGVDEDNDDPDWGCDKEESS